MGIKINFDAAGNPVEPTFVLTSHSGDNRLGILTGVSNIKIAAPLMNYEEVSCTVTKCEETIHIWDEIFDLRLIYSPEWDIFLQIHVELDDADATVKNITATGLCQAELSQALVHGLEFNTEEDIKRDDYERSLIYNFQNPNASILHGLFNKFPHYTIKHVDASIASMQKTFSFDGISVTSALDEIAKECHCVVIYENSLNPDTGMPMRAISIYDLETTCNKCGYRGDYTDICPECGSTDLKYGYGNDTRIFISKDNLTDKITFSCDLDSVKNCFKLVAGDDVMTSAIQACNANGTDYIWYISEELKSDMSVELVEKINEYDTLYEYYSKEHVTTIPVELVNNYNTLIEKYTPYNKDLKKIENPNMIGYSSLMNMVYDVIDFESFLKSSLMPIDDTVKDTTAEKEAAKLTTESLSPIALSTVSKYDEELINRTVLSVARIIVDTRYDVKIKESKLFVKDEEEEGRKHQWVGSFTVTNYADSSLTADSKDILIFINKDYDAYIKQRVEKVLADTESKDFDISNLLKIDKSLEEFCEDIKPYNISVLLNLKEACDTCLDTLQSESIGNPQLWKDPETGVNMYDKYYLNYYNKLEAIVDEIELKTKDKDTVHKVYTFVTDERNKIQDILNFEKFLGEKLWLIFCTYRREDIYKNENYISEGLDNAQIFDNAREFYEIARKEIFKSATMQHTLTADLKNLLAIPEFEPLRDSFERGNWLRVDVDGVIYRLRLTQYTIDYNDLTTLPVEFSDCTQTADGLSDINSLLSKLNDMSTSYGGVQRQASKGEESYERTDDWFTNGLDATLTKIVDSSETQDVVVDNHGILIRDYDKVTESYYPEQMKFINSTLALTTDNWKTLKTAIGKFIYQDPLTKDMKTGYGVNAETVIGRLILGQELGIYNDKATMRFDENGLTIYNDVNNFRVNPNSETLLSLSKDDVKMLWVDENGMLHIKGDGAGLDISSNDTIKGLETQFSVTAEGIRGYVDNKTEGVRSEFNQTANRIEQKVEDTKNGLDSKIDQTAYELSHTMNDYKNEISSSIKQTASEIRAEVTDVNKGLNSKIDQTAGQIRQEVTDVENHLNSSISQTAGEILSKVNDTENKLNSSISQTAGEIYSRVESVYDGLSTSIRETAGQLRLEATSKYEGLQGSIDVQAGKIEMLVKSDEGLQSQITQNYNQIQMLVSNGENNYAQIKVELDKITQEVIGVKNENQEISNKVIQTEKQTLELITNFKEFEKETTNRFDRTDEYTHSSIGSLVTNKRNLAMNTSNRWTDRVLPETDNENITVMQTNIKIKGKGITSEKNNTLTFHFDAKFSDDFAPTSVNGASMTLYVNANPSGVPNYIYEDTRHLNNILNSSKKEDTVSFTLSIGTLLAGNPDFDDMSMFIVFSNYKGTFWYRNVMVEIGSKTNGWLPAPEDTGGKVGEDWIDVQSDVIQTKEKITSTVTTVNGLGTKIEQTVDKVFLSATGEDGSSELSITPDGVKLISDSIDLTGKVTFSSFNMTDTDTQNFVGQVNKIGTCLVSATPYYAKNTSKDIPPDTTITENELDSKIWSQTYPEIKQDPEDKTQYFIWQMTRYKYGDGSVTFSKQPICLTDGTQVVSIEVQYFEHNSNTVPPSIEEEGSWKNTPPKYKPGKYIWTRNYITYADGTTRTTTPVYDSTREDIYNNLTDTLPPIIKAGINQVFYQSEDPIYTVSYPLKTGDIWYKIGKTPIKDENGSSTDVESIVGIYHYANGQWEEHKAGTTTILGGSITTDLLAADAVTAKVFAGNRLTSLNYGGLNPSDEKFALKGLNLELGDGNLRTPNFSIGQKNDGSGSWIYGKGFFTMVSDNNTESLFSIEGIPGKCGAIIGNGYIRNSLDYRTDGSVGICLDPNDESTGAGAHMLYVSNGKFRVDKDGNITCQNLEFKGKFTHNGKEVTLGGTVDTNAIVNTVMGKIPNQTFTTLQAKNMSITGTGDVFNCVGNAGFQSLVTAKKLKVLETLDFGSLSQNATMQIKNILFNPLKIGTSTNAQTTIEYKHLDTVRENGLYINTPIKVKGTIETNLVSAETMNAVDGLGVSGVSTFKGNIECWYDNKIKFKYNSTNGMVTYHNSEIATKSDLVGLGGGVSQTYVDSKISEVKNMIPDTYDIISNMDRYSVTIGGTLTVNDGHIINKYALQHPGGGGYQLYINSDGVLHQTASSSIRYKNVISSLTSTDIQSLYNIPTYWFKYKKDYLVENDERYDTPMPGFIVEDFEEVMPILVNHNDDGSPEMWNEHIVVPVMFEMIKDTHKETMTAQDEIKELKQEIELLKETIRQLSVA